MCFSHAKTPAKTDSTSGSIIGRCREESGLRTESYYARLNSWTHEGLKYIPGPRCLSHDSVRPRSHNTSGEHGQPCYVTGMCAEAKIGIMEVGQDICLGRTMEGGRSWQSTDHNPRDGLTNQVAGLEIASSHAKGHGGCEIAHPAFRCGCQKTVLGMRVEVETGFPRRSGTSYWPHTSHRIDMYRWTRQETVDEEAVVVVKDGLRGISVSGCQTAMGYILGNRWAHNLGWMVELNGCKRGYRRFGLWHDRIALGIASSAFGALLPSLIQSRIQRELMNGLIDDQEILWREDMSHYGCSVCECLPVEESTIERHTWVQGDDTPTPYRLPLNAPCLSPMAHLRDGNVNAKPRAPNFVQDGLLCKSMRSTNILNPASSWANQLQALCKVDEFIWKARSSRTFRPQIEAIHDGKFSGALPPGSRGAEGHESCAQYILLTNRYRTINTG
ncbi:hypothetical protein DFH09DRAFT_1102485 [Mycena vulgaris]|nr:hypothetical protein DFH09DRAFT_1102485 [Mycena vulgaris]